MLATYPSILNVPPQPQPPTPHTFKQDILKCFTIQILLFTRPLILKTELFLCYCSILYSFHFFSFSKNTFASRWGKDWTLALSLPLCIWRLFLQCAITAAKFIRHFKLWYVDWRKYLWRVFAKLHCKGRKDNSS